MLCDTVRSMWVNGLGEIIIASQVQKTVTSCTIWVSPSNHKVLKMGEKWEKFQKCVVWESRNQLLLILKTKEGLFYLSCHCNKISDKKQKKEQEFILANIWESTAHCGSTGMGGEGPWIISFTHKEGGASNRTGWQDLCARDPFLLNMAGSWIISGLR